MNNGHNPTPPLRLNSGQRAAILTRAGLTSGWLLLSVSEMFDMKKAMESAQSENERLNKQTARILAAKLLHEAVADKTLRSARGFAEVVAKWSGSPPSLAIDAAKEIAHIDEALSILPKSPEQATA